MKSFLGLIGAIIGAGLAVFYLGSLASDTYMATKTFESPEDAMTHHSTIYLASIIVSVTIGWFLGRLVGLIFFRK